MSLTVEIFLMINATCEVLGHSDMVTSMHVLEIEKIAITNTYS